jgi:UDP-glucose 4-epimerase
MKSFAGKKVIVTGGAGFIGSHIVDRLIHEGARVEIIDNLSTGHLAYLQAQKGHFAFHQKDILNSEAVLEITKETEAVFHFAANADVRGGMQNTQVDLEQNVIATHNVLEACRINGVKRLVFASSATVYGEPDRFPTPENAWYPQTSVYGASKLASEALIQAYSEYFGIQSFAFRFVSWIGERYSHGVVFDFIKKLQANPSCLEILGDGKQKKSYLYVKDGVDGIFLAIDQSQDLKNILNLGHQDMLAVTEVASIVVDEMGLKDAAFQFGGGIRGWLGDSPIVHLDTTRIRAFGWEPTTSIRDGIRRTVRYLLDNPELLSRT